MDRCQHQVLLPADGSALRAESVSLCAWNEVSVRMGCGACCVSVLDHQHHQGAWPGDLPDAAEVFWKVNLCCTKIRAVDLSLLGGKYAFHLV